MMVAAGVPPSAFNVPPRSTQSRLRITSASFIAAVSSLLVEGRGCADMQRMVGWKRRADMQARRDPGAERLGERDAPVPGGEVA